MSDVGRFEVLSTPVLYRRIKSLSNVIRKISIQIELLPIQKKNVMNSNITFSVTLFFKTDFEISISNTSF